MSTGDVILLTYLFLSFTHVKRVKDLQKRKDTNANTLEVCNLILNTQVMKCIHFFSHIAPPANN